MDDSNTVFSYLTSMVKVAPDRVHSNSASATSAILEDPTIKGIFADAGARIQVSATATTSDTYTITLVIPKSQVAMMVKMETPLVDKGGNSYSLNALMPSGRTYLGHIISKPIGNG